MASQTISKASVYISTDAQELDKGLKKAKSEVHKFSQDVEKTKAPKIPKPELDKPPKIPKPEKLKPEKIPKPEVEKPEQQDLSGIIKGSIYLAAAATVFAGLKKAAEAVIETFNEIGEKIRQTGIAARDLGVSVTGLSKLEYYAKVSGIEVKTLHAAINGLGEAMASLKAPQLFASVGVDFKAISALPIDQQFAAIAEGLSKIADPLQRVKLADQIFPGMGAELANLLPLISQGAEGVKKFTEEAAKRGLVVSPESVEQIRKVQESTARLEGLWDGVKQKVIMAMLPIAEKGATLLDPIMQAVDKTMPALYEGFKKAAFAVAHLVDVMKITAGIWLEYLAVPASEAMATTIGALQEFINALKKIPGAGKLLGAMAGLDDLGAPLQGMTNQAKQLADAWKKTKMGDTKKDVKEFFDWLEQNAGKAASNLVKPIDALKVKLLQAVNDLEKQLKKSIATIGMTSGEAQIWELKQQGASPEMLAGVEQLAQKAKEVEAGWQTIQLPPFDLWERQVAGLNAMLQDGRINLQQYAQGITTAGQELTSKMGTNTHKLPTALIKDSREAVSAAIQHDMRGKINADPQAQVKQALYEQKAIQEKQLKVQQQLTGIMQDQKQGAMVLAVF